MIKANVYNSEGEKVKELELNPAVFGLKVKPALVTQVVVAQQANARQVLADTKDRSEVRGGGKKPWKQKGTGRARHGSRRSPIWRGGGITFGPTTDRNFTQKINRKVKRQALLMTLSDKAAHERIILLDNLKIEPKTKKFYNLLQNLDLRAKKAKAKAKDVKAETAKAKIDKKIKSVLVVVPKKSAEVERAARNIPAVDIIAANSLNVIDVLHKQYLLIPVDALSEIEKTYIK